VNPGAADEAPPVTVEAGEPAAVPSQDSREALTRHTAVMSVGTALSRLTGFLRLTAMAYALGIVETRITDSYNIANTTPNIVYELALGGILSSVFVPVFVEWLQTRGREEAWDVARRVLTVAVVLLSALAVVAVLFAPWIIRLYTFGIADAAERAATRDLATFFLRWFMPQILFYGIGAVAIGLLNAHRRFAAPMFAPVLNNVVTVATFVTFAVMAGPEPLRPGHAITGPQKLVLAIGTTLGVVAMTVALWPSLRRLGFRMAWRWSGSRRHEAVRRIAHLAKWAVVYVVVNQLGYLIVLILAAGTRGDYSAYANAFVLFQLPHAIFAVSIFTALLPAMSSRWADGDVNGFRGLLVQGLRATAFIVIPAAAGYLVLARPIVRLLLKYGETTAASIDAVSSVLVFFSIGLFSFSSFQLLLRAFYSMQDTRTPALINIAAVALNTLVNLLYFFVFGLGVRGLALGHATAYTFAAATSAIVIRRRLGGLEGRRVLAGLARVFVAAAATAGTAWGVSLAIGRALGTSTVGERAAQVLGAVGAGLLVFVALALIFHLEEVDVVRSTLRGRTRR
jgi:putative peptidoglycan lipid II flippase